VADDLHLGSPEPVGSGANKDRVRLVGMRVAEQAAVHLHTRQHVVLRSEAIAERVADLLACEISPGHDDRRHARRVAGLSTEPRSGGMMTS
jgi:hypothetical protein